MHTTALHTTALELCLSTSLPCERIEVQFDVTPLGLLSGTGTQ